MRQLEEPAAGDVHIVVRPVAMVIGWLAASGAAGTHLWGHTRRSGPAPAPASSKGHGVGARTRRAGRRETTGQPPGRGLPPRPPSKGGAPKGRAVSPTQELGTLVHSCALGVRRAGRPAPTRRTRARALLTGAGGWAATAASAGSTLASASTSRQPSSSTWTGPGTKGVKQEAGSAEPTSPSLRTQTAQAGGEENRHAEPPPPSLGGTSAHPSSGWRASPAATPP